MASETSKKALNHLVKDLGSLNTWKKQANGIEGETSAAKFQVEVHNDKTIRIRITKNEQYDNFPYTISGAPDPTRVIVSEHKTEITIKTKSVILHIQKDPVRFSFHNKGGELISQDDPGLGSSWMGNEVTTYRTLQDGERFVGLGEKNGEPG